MLNSTYHSEPAIRRVRNPVVTMAEEEEEEVAGMRSSDPKSVELKELFYVFSLFFRRPSVLACQEQFSCQGRKNFFHEKKLDIAYGDMVKSPLAPGGILSHFRENASFFFAQRQKNGGHLRARRCGTYMPAFSSWRWRRSIES